MKIIRSLYNAGPDVVIVLGVYVPIISIIVFFALGRCLGRPNVKSESSSIHEYSKLAVNSWWRDGLFEMLQGRKGNR